MNRTSIEWVRNPDGTQGYTWNPITGCLNHSSGMCKGGDFPCYAYRLAHGRLKQRYLANDNTIMQCAEGFVPMTLKVTDPFHPRFWWGELAEMVWQQGTKPKGIFVCNMAELFGDWVPELWQHRILSAMRVNPQHRFYLLTKQPQNLIKWSPFPDNCWVGVTATTYGALIAALTHLRQIEAKVKYLSLEPLLEKVLTGTDDNPWLCIDWIILGAQTKPVVYPRISWVQQCLIAAHTAGDLRVFMKENLRPLIEKEWPGWPILQELPSG